MERFFEACAWDPGSMAADENGFPADPLTPEAVAYSIGGVACASLSREMVASICMDAIRKAVRAEHKVMTIVEFERTIARSKDDVLALLAKAQTYIGRSRPMQVTR